jgi:uncharacterized membrane protein
MKSEIKLNSTYWLLGILIISVGAYLRINEAIVNDLWYDEAFTGMTIRQSWSDVLQMMSHDWKHPPTFYSMVKFVTMVTGSTDPFHIRLVPLFFGILTIPLGYWLIQQLSLAAEDKKYLGLVTMSVLSFSPFFIRYSREARSYSFLLFLMLVAIIYFIKSSKNSFRFSRDLMIFTIILMIIMMTHFLSILIVTGFFVAFALLRMEENKTFYNTKLMKRVGVIALLGWLAITWAWSTAHLEKILEPLNPSFLLPRDLSIIPITISDFLFNIPENTHFLFSLFPGNLGFVILIASVIAFIIVFQKSIDNRESVVDIIILTSLGFVPLIIDILAASFGLRMYLPRYVIGYGTMLIIWILYVWWRIANKQMLWIICVYFALLFFVDRTPFTKYSEVISQISADSTIAIGTPYDYVVFRYYLPKAKLMLLEKNDDVGYDPFVSAATLVTKEDVMPGSMAVMYKEKPVPSTWKPKFDTSDFRVYEYAK